MSEPTVTETPPQTTPYTIRLTLADEERITMIRGSLRRATMADAIRCALEEYCKQHFGV